MFTLRGMIILVHGYSVKESLFEFASMVGTVGLLVEVTTANGKCPLEEILEYLLNKLG